MKYKLLLQGPIEKLRSSDFLLKDGWGKGGRERWMDGCLIIVNGYTDFNQSECVLKTEK